MKRLAELSNEELAQALQYAQDELRAGTRLRDIWTKIDELFETAPPTSLRIVSIAGRMSELSTSKS